MKKTKVSKKKSWRPHEVQKREAQLLRCIPDILANRSLLYVGANVKRMEMLCLFAERGCRIDILEIWPANVDKLVEWNVESMMAERIILGDVRNVDGERSHDCVMWWHGPEHVTEAELPGALARLERAARRIVILACPSGKSEQDNAYGNPFEKHEAAIYERDLHDLGYETDIIGKTNKDGSNLLAWKRMVQ